MARKQVSSNTPTAAGVRVEIRARVAGSATANADVEVSRHVFDKSLTAGALPGAPGLALPL
jgi:hypothetical protein